MPDGFAVLAGMRETAPGSVKIGSGGLRAMFAADFSAAGHFAMMPGKGLMMLRGVFWSLPEPFSSPPRPILRPGRF